MVCHSFFTPQQFLHVSCSFVQEDHAPAAHEAFKFSTGVLDFLSIKQRAARSQPLLSQLSPRGKKSSLQPWTDLCTQRQAYCFAFSPYYTYLYSKCFNPLSFWLLGPLSAPKICFLAYTLFSFSYAACKQFGRAPSSGRLSTRSRLEDTLWLFTERTL